MSFKTKAIPFLALGSLALVSLLALTTAAAQAGAGSAELADAAAGGLGDCDHTRDMTSAQDRDMDQDRDGTCDLCSDVNCQEHLYGSPGPHGQ